MLTSLLESCEWTGWDLIEDDTIETVTGQKKIWIRSDTKKIVTITSTKTAIRKNEQVVAFANDTADKLNWTASHYDLQTKIISVITNNKYYIIIPNDVINKNTPRAYYYIMRDGIIWPVSMYITDKIAQYNRLEQHVQQDIINNASSFDNVNSELFAHEFTIARQEMPQIVKTISVATGLRPVSTQLVNRTKAIGAILTKGAGVTNMEILRAIGTYVDNQKSSRAKRVNRICGTINHILFDVGAKMKTAALQKLAGDKCSYLTQ